jgi:uncharacterized membrane protein
MPITNLFFKNLSDKGFSIASVIGWFGMSYIAFVLMTIKLLPVTPLAIAIVVFIWIAVNAFVQYRFKTFDIKQIDYIQIGKINALFLILFAFMYYLKAHQAEIYQIERFMDYGFIKALFNTDSLPLQDIWFSGEALNYYYFSHFVGFIILSLTFIPTEAGFYILTAWIFGIVGINMFRLGKDIGLSLSINNKTFALISGLISLFWGIFGGVLHSAYWVYKTFEENTNQLLYGWYAEPTRVIAGTITEIPIYSYLVAELHAHMWGMVVALIVLSFLLNFWVGKKAIITIHMKEYWLLATTLGIAFMVNSWDVVTLGVLSGFVILLKYAISKGQSELKKSDFVVFIKAVFSNYSEFTLLFISLILLPVFAVGIAMPWKYYFEAPVSGVGIVKNVSDIVQWFSFWGQFVVIFILFFYTAVIANTKSFFKNFWKNFVNSNSGIAFIVAVFSMVVLFWIIMEIIYVKDILLEGEWYRANTFFKITAQLWIWLAAITGPMTVFILVRTKGKAISKISFVIIWLIFSICSIYPVKAIWQAALENKPYRGIESGLDFWKNKYPFDYEAYEFLENKRKELPENEKMKVILEAEGDSYSDNNYFSVFLGWPAVVGWPVHEWTWRGSYDAVGARRSEVVEVYTGVDMETAKNILDKYKVDYIILGQIEKLKYPDRINYLKLQSLGRVIFENDETQIIEVQH